MYDIFFLGDNIDLWKNCKSKYPNSQKISKDIKIEDLQKKSFTSMFWVIWDDLDLSEFDLNSYKATKWDNQYIHIFKNKDFYDGVCLISKKINISNREFNNRFFINKKEIDIIASYPIKYETYNLKSYDDYLSAIADSKTEMFWGIYHDLILSSDFKFDYYVPKYDSFHRNITHIFKNGKYYDGICLFSKNTLISKREFDYRFFTNKKEVDILASEPKPFDVVFISYFEKFADENYKKIKNHLLPNQDLYRVDGVKGIHNAHKCAAEIVKSDMFWVVDADAILEKNFKFEFPQVINHDSYTKTIVHVWKSKNPINDLEYGHGGVKLLPKKLTMNMDMSKPDMTTSISASFKSMPTVSNIAGFNTDPFTTWRSAFRECVKLSSRTIQGQVDKETEQRLDIWCTIGKDRQFGNYAIDGAKAGREYGLINRNDINELSKINDFKWLEEKFYERYRTN